MRNPLIKKCGSVRADGSMLTTGASGNPRVAILYLDLNIVANESREAKIDIVLSNSFGFGGTNASILIKRFAE